MNSKLFFRFFAEPRHEFHPPSLHYGVASEFTRGKPILNRRSVKAFKRTAPRPDREPREW